MGEGLFMDIILAIVTSLVLITGLMGFVGIIGCHCLPDDLVNAFVKYGIIGFVVFALLGILILWTLF